MSHSPWVIERFWRGVPDQPGADCWEWRGGRQAPGYGNFGTTRDGKRQKWFAHRVSYELHRGPIPEGMYVCHACDNPPCVNPDHLFLGGALENNRDMTAKGRHGQAAKTHCPKGHEYTSENTYVYDNRRTCRECDRIRSVEKNKRRRFADGKTVYVRQANG